LINIVNKKTYKRSNKDCAVYIGRPSKLGNQFKIEYGCSREEAINRYKIWLDQQLLSTNTSVLSKYIKVEINRILNLIKVYGHVDLICWCAPLACHGVVIKEIIEKRLLNER
jgi:hypothetical protein